MKRLSLILLVMHCLLLVTPQTSFTAEEIRIAVLDFDNSTGNPDLDRFKSGFSETISSFIANADGITIVERKRLDDTLDELLITNSGIFDEDKAVQIGKLLQANMIIVGSFLFENNVYRITYRALEVETSAVKFAAQAENRDIYRAMDDISIKILNNLGYEVKEAPRTLIRRVGPWSTLLLTVGSVGGTFLMNSQGNDAYDNYTQTVDPEKMKSYYDDASSFDSKRNILIGVSTGAAILTAYLYKTRKAKDWDIRRRDEEARHKLIRPWVAFTPNGSCKVGLTLGL